MYANCAGFIRVSDKYFVHSRARLGELLHSFNIVSPNSNSTDPLDDTRIHPEDYRLARKMAADALDREDDYEKCIKDIMNKPKKLDDIGMLSFEHYFDFILFRFTLFHFIIDFIYLLATRFGCFCNYA